MRKPLLLLFVFCLGTLFFGCKKEKVDPSLPKMEVDFTWPEEHECYDSKSPEIRVEGVPEGTESFLVTLFDISNNYDHGGGTVEFEGKNYIAEGSVNGTYRGPCPLGWGLSPDFALTVKALDASGKVIGIGEKIKPHFLGYSQK